MSMGWTPAQSAGIAANLQAESGFRPNAVGDGGLAYGIAQWHPDRQAYFEKVMGKPIAGSTLEEQMAFVHTELTSTERVAGYALKGCDTAAEAGACVSKMYERPADREGEAAKRAALAAKIAGEAHQPAAPIEDHSVPYQPREETSTMAPLALAGIFGEVLKALIPQVGKLFGGQKDAANAQAIGTVFDTIVTATKQTLPADVGKVGAAIQQMQESPAIRAEVAKAIVTEPSLMALLEVGGGVTKARVFDLAQQNQDKPFYKASAVFWISVLLLPMAVWLVGSLIVGGTVFKLMPMVKEFGVNLPDWMVLFLALFGDAWQGETRSGGFNLVIGLILGGICGVYYGVSVTQQRQQGNRAESEPLGIQE